MHCGTLGGNTICKRGAGRLRAGRAALLAVIVGCLLNAACGCRHVEHAEAEHHAPPHKPADYPAAVERLLELHVELVNDRQRAPGELEALAEAYDVARWLPELAADSDLKEQPWLRVEHAARRMEALLAPILQQEGSGRLESYRARETDWDALHRELLAVKQLFPDREADKEADKEPDEESEAPAADAGSMEGGRDETLPDEKAGSADRQPSD